MFMVWHQTPHITDPLFTVEYGSPVIQRGCREGPCLALLDVQAHCCAVGM